MKFPCGTSHKRLLLVIVASILSATAANARSKTIPPSLANCGGDELATYVGKPVDTLQMRNLTNARFVCKGCAMIADFRSSRLTVIYSKQDNLILSMHCG
jgi:hypothetical protein